MRSCTLLETSARVSSDPWGSGLKDLGLHCTLQIPVQYDLYSKLFAMAKLDMIASYAERTSSAAVICTRTLGAKTQPCFKDISNFAGTLPLPSFISTSLSPSSCRERIQTSLQSLIYQIPPSKSSVKSLPFDNGGANSSWIIEALAWCPLWELFTRDIHHSYAWQLKKTLQW